VAYEIDREQWQKLPDVYNKQVGSNTRLKYEVVAEVIDDINDLFAEIEGLETLENVYGYTLDLLGFDFGVKRNGLSDTAFRALIFAKRSNSIGGNSVDRILEYMSFYVGPGMVHLVELWDVSTTYFLDATRPLDGSWSFSAVTNSFLLDASRPLDASWFLSGEPLQKFRGFYIQATGLSEEQRAILTEILPNLKAGGIYGVINGD